ncbi:Rne/Rng family ribonuclease [Fervidobacterium nodosum]|uniref:Ribonuclease, Rne/Rng family n=1 Tax=Fervidobacterium nodosum (strain ATCC 35602 / DSM 5306 / Rt17-B1) TaxID=381764 RepID=A7HJB9_FERNB|nr:Rne/Rng family ribonuclease [Fervidobacterium nodosum]ABS60002.1 ribonuclease, Rne/Rng family [Fervidobacterium nodosum Rt17-B1]
MILLLKKDGENEKAQAALIENGILAEIFISDDDEESIAGNIYIGKIEKFIPALEAAFVKLPDDENAFLRIKDIKNEYLNFFGISKLQECQKILVQIKKEGGNTKGPQVTTNIGIPGRYIVYMPFSKSIGISRKITNENDRKHLREVGEKLKSKYNCGFILRTSCVESKEEYIEKEAEELHKKWEEIVNTFKRSRKTKLIHKESDSDEFVVREFLRKEVEQVITNSQKLKVISKDFKPNIPVKLIESDPFEEYNVYKQIQNSMKRIHELPSGGEIVIDKTEALTIIDVNSGHYTSSESHEELSKKINIEAAKEICRLIRLRNIGGIIIIDFIDMKNEENRLEILNAIKSETLKDKNKIEVYGFTQLGLLEMARKRTSKSLDEKMTALCPVCNGTGHVMSPKFVIERLLKEVKNKPKNAKEVIIKFHPSLKEFINKDLLRKTFKVPIHIHFTHLDPESYEITWKI